MEVVPQSARRGEPGCGMCGFLPSPAEKKSGLHPNASEPAFFIFPPHQTKSNPDMRNSKLAHIQAGF